MIQFSSVVTALLQQPLVEPFYLVRIGAYKVTSHFSNVLLSSGDLYLADGRLVSVDAPKLSSSVDREIYKVTLADSDYGLSYLIDGNLVGSLFEVRIGFVDQVTKQPVTAIEDTLLAYRGIVDNGGYSIKTGNVGETVLQISGASPMADLDATRAFYGSRDYIKSIAPGDTSFDQVYEGSGPVNVKWGKG